MEIVQHHELCQIKVLHIMLVLILRVMHLLKHDIHLLDGLLHLDEQLLMEIVPVILCDQQIQISMQFGHKIRVVERQIQLQ